MLAFTLYSAAEYKKACKPISRIVAYIIAVSFFMQCLDTWRMCNKKTLESAL